MGNQALRPVAVESDDEHHDDAHGRLWRAYKNALDNGQHTTSLLAAVRLHQLEEAADALADVDAALQFQDEFGPT